MNPQPSFFSTTGGPATPPAKNAHMVLVDVQTARTMNPQRRKRPTIMSEFDGLNSQGEPWRYRFLDANKQPLNPRLPMEIDISTQSGQDLLKTMRAYKLFYDPSITIFDPVEAARAEVTSDDRMLEAMGRVKELRLGQDTETMVNLLRRLEGPIGTKTPDMVITALHRIAKTDPDSLLTLDSDPRFKQKVLIDKAVEAKRLVRREQYFYYPENVYDGRLIAEGEEKLLLMMNQDADLYAYVSQAADSLTQQALPALSQPPTPLLTDAQRAILRELDDVGAPALKADGSVDELNELDETQIRQLVQKAIAINFLEEQHGKVRVTDGTFLLPADAEVYFVTNPRAAEAMRAEMLSQGMLT